MTRKRKPKNLTIDPEVMAKFEAIANERDMSVSALAEQVMHITTIVYPIIDNLPPEKLDEINTFAEQRPEYGMLAAILHVIPHEMLGAGHAIEKRISPLGGKSKEKDVPSITSDK